MSGATKVVAEVPVCGNFFIYVKEGVEKARAFDPFGHAGFDPSGKIRMTP